jgi:hypothetical protein
MSWIAKCSNRTLPGTKRGNTNRNGWSLSLWHPTPQHSTYQVPAANIESHSANNGARVWYSVGHTLYVNYLVIWLFHIAQVVYHRNRQCQKWPVTSSCSKCLHHAITLEGQKMWKTREMTIWLKHSGVYLWDGTRARNLCFIRFVLS